MWKTLYRATSRYQDFEDLEVRGKGMITFNRRKVSLFEVDVAIGCLLGFYLGNGIQDHSGRAYKWCPFWGTMGATSVRITSITENLRLLLEIACSRHLRDARKR